jgi:hypothetical protein
LTGSHAALIKTTIDLKDRLSKEIDPEIKCIALTTDSLKNSNKIISIYKTKDSLTRASLAL